MGHPLRFHPDTHTVCITQLQHVAHTLNTFDLRNHVYIQIIGQECLIISFIGTDQRVDLEETGLSLCCTDTDLCHLRRQQTLRLGNTVLYVDRRHIRIGSLLKVDLNLGRSRVGRRRGDINHVLDTIDILLQRHDHTVHHRVSVRARISCLHTNRWWRDVRILLNRQRTQRDESDDQDQDRDRQGHNRPLNKYISFHTATFLILPVFPHAACPRLQIRSRRRPSSHPGLHIHGRHPRERP